MSTTTTEHDTDREVPPGYKRTEVGVIPEDWRVVEIGELKPFVTSGSRGWAQFYATEGRPFIRITNLSRQSIDLDLSDLKLVALSPQADAEAVRTELRDGDLLISITADVGIIGIVDSILQKPAHINQHIALIRFDQSRISSRFVAYSLASERPQKLFTASMDVGAKAGMSLLTVRKVQLPLPPPAEQRAIAAALSDVDALLAALDALLAKKRAIKQATMQQLLTGATRLPGFEGEWERKRLGSIGVFSKGKGIKREDVTTDGIPCVRYGEIYTNYSNYIKTFLSYIPTGKAAQSQLIRKGDILFAGSGETAEEIGKCVAFLGDDEAYAGGDIVVFRPAKQNSLFLAYLLNHPSVAAQKARMGQGDAVVHIGARNLAALELHLPPIPEQQAIAAVLADMDAEIEALERRREKTRQIKQGMMQQLLTGRIRLLHPVEAGGEP